MRILITGGAGMVGSHSAEYFALKNEEVIVLDNLMRSELFGYNKASVEYNWNYLKKYRNIKLIKGDVRNEKDLNKAIGKGVEVIIHTAGQPGVPSSVRMPRDDFSINAFGTLNTLECAREKNKHTIFIYCSTNKVYGENVDKIPLTEQKTRYIYNGVSGISEELPTDLTGHTPYGVSKLTGDLYSQEYGYIYGMRTGIFRMSCIYGERQFGFEDQGWVAWFVIATLFNLPITIYGDGKQVRDLLYVTDLVRAFDKFIQSNLKTEVLNIGGGADNNLSLLEFFEILKEQTGKQPKTSFSDWRPSDQKVYISDITKIKTKLNWQPNIDVKKGIKRLINWVKDNESYFS